MRAQYKTEQVGLGKRFNAGRYRVGATPRWRSANTLIEMVVSFQLLLLVGFGTVEFGQYFYIKHAFESAARDGCRVAILPTSTQAQVVAAMTSTLTGANVTYNSNWLMMTDATTSTTITDCATVPAGDMVQIKLSTTYNTISNVVRPLYSCTGGGIRDGKVMKGMCTMVKE